MVIGGEIAVIQNGPIMYTDYRKYFKIVTSVSRSIHSGACVQDIIRTIVEEISGLLSARGGVYWILNSASGTIEAKVSHGFPYQSLLKVDYETLDAIFDLNANNPIYIDDARYNASIPNLERVGKKWIVSICGCSVNILPPYKGLLAVYFSRKQKVTPIEFDLILSLAEQGAIALQKALLYDERMLESFRQAVESLVIALEAKDPVTHGHSLRVAQLARLTAHTMGLSARETDMIYHAGLLHDIGKIGMKDSLLCKLGNLTAGEMDIVRKHPEIGAAILEPLALLTKLAPLVRHHHERFDGTGYPGGLKGEAIPPGARILAVCDAFETMIRGRSKMKPIQLEEAVRQLRANAGKRFDPGVTEALIHSISRYSDILLFLDAARSSLDSKPVDESYSNADGSAPKWYRLFPASF